MGRKKNSPQSAETKEEKKSKKGVNVPNDLNGKDQEFEITATLIDCTYCEALQNLIDSLESECNAANDLIESQKKLIEAQDKVIDKQRRHIERLTAAAEYFSKCLDWAEKHLRLFTRRKYKKMFSIENLSEFIFERVLNNVHKGLDVEANEDNKMLKELSDFGKVQSINK